MPVFEKTRNKKKFTNVHGNYKKLPYKKHYHVFNKAPGFTLSNYKNTSLDIAELINEAIEGGRRLRIVGSKWSLSRAPYVDDTLLFTKNEHDAEDLKYKGFLNAAYLENSEDKMEFLFAQCGNTIEDLNLFCQNQKRSLSTSGASNGQTIAGAIGTGVHGSALGTGSIQDFVAGLHIIKGNDPDDSILVQAETDQVVNNKLAAKIGAVLINDDDLFHAALVSIGTFGFIHGVIIKTEPRFKLLNRIREVDLEDVFDFDPTTWIAGSPIDVAHHLRVEHGNEVHTKEPRIDEMTSKNLHHVKFYINQYKASVKAEIMYKVSDQAPRGESNELIGYEKDIPVVEIKNRGLLDWAIPGLINLGFPPDGKREIGYLNDIFKRSKNVNGHEFSTCVAVPIAKAREVYILMINYFNSKDARRIPAAFSIRYVKKSKASMAFTKFAMNALIGVDGLTIFKTRERFDHFMKYVTEALDKSKITHAWHWGKVNKMNAVMIQDIYGQQLNDWHRIRATFLTPEMRRVFSSDYTDKLGLTV